MGRFDGLNRAIRIAMTVADLQLNCPKTRPRITAGTEWPVRFADLFRIGIGASSSHIIGSIEAAAALYRETARGGLATNLAEC
jgi:hypothetical protein